MKRIPHPRFVFLSLALLLAALPSLQAEEPITVPSPDGETYTPLVLVEGKKANVLFFASPYCNTSNTFMPDILRIAADFTDDFAFFMVHAEPGLKITDVLAHSTIFEVPFTAVLDEELALAKKTQATITPEVVVVGADGATLYHGRINDLYLTKTQPQQAATKHDLREVLEAIQAGKSPEPETVEAVGCKISGLGS